MTFAEVLKTLRKEKGISQQELAHATGIKQSSIGMYEIGARMPSYDALYALADYFNVDVNTLLGREQLKTTDEDKAVLAVYHKLNDMGKKTIIATMKSYTLMPEFSAVSFDQAAKDILASPVFPDAQSHNAALASEMRTQSHLAKTKK